MRAVPPVPPNGLTSTRTDAFEPRVKPCARMGEAERATPEEEPDVATDVGERVKAVIAAAETASQAMLSDAEEQAEARRREAEEAAARLLEQAREETNDLARGLRASGEEFLESARAVVEYVADSQRQLEDLVEELRANFARLSLEAVQAREGAAASSSGPPKSPVGAERDDVADAEAGLRRRANDLTAVAPDDREQRAGSIATPIPRSGDASEERADEDHARLIALQMAAAGKSRGEVAYHLQQHCDLDRIETVLAHVFGPGQS